MNLKVGHKLKMLDRWFRVHKMTRRDIVLRRLTTEDAARAQKYQDKLDSKRVEGVTG